MRVEKTVFISYRRTNVYHARTVYLALTMHGYDVFLDYENIDSGAFDQIILRQIDARAHFLIILTPSALERCGDPNDWLRREIERAIEMQRNIVPLMFAGFNFESVQQYLVDRLAVLSQYQGLNVHDDYFDEAIERLDRRFLSKPLDTILQPTLPQDRAEVAQRQAVAQAAPAPTEEQLTAEQYFERGYSRGKQGDHAGAMVDFAEAIRLNPHNAVAYYNRGLARKNQGDYAGAIADFSEAIHLNPQDANAYHNRGAARADQKDYAGAIADCSEAIRLNPQDAIAYINRGLARKNQGDYAGAIADFSEAIHLNPQDAIAYINRGAARADQKDYAGAIADCSEAIRLNPQDAIAYINRGEVNFALKKFDQALNDFKKANELTPGYNFALGGLGITYHAMGNLKEARRLWCVLLGMDKRYRDVEWVKKELNWVEPLVEEARKLIAGL